MPIQHEQGFSQKFELRKGSSLIMSAGVENRDRSDSITGLKKPERMDSDKNFASPALSPGLMS